MGFAIDALIVICTCSAACLLGFIMSRRIDIRNTDTYRLGATEGYGQGYADGSDTDSDEAFKAGVEQGWDEALRECDVVEVPFTTTEES